MRSEVRCARGLVRWLPDSWDAFALPNGEVYRIRRGAATGRRYATRVRR